MTRISLIATVHEEQGLANVSELRSILERTRPDVIFLEIPPAAFDDYRHGTRSNLESSAARSYQEKNDVVLLSVDLPTPDTAFFRHLENVYRTVERVSPDYRRLVDQHSSDVAQFGFPYLNSERVSRVWSDIYEATDAALKQHADSNSLAFYTSWKHTNERRDMAMLASIKESCLGRPFANGVFLVGAARRQSLLTKLREQSGAGAPLIEWDLFSLGGASTWCRRPRVLVRHERGQY